MFSTGPIFGHIITLDQFSLYLLLHFYLHLLRGSVICHLTYESICVNIHLTPSLHDRFVPRFVFAVSANCCSYKVSTGFTSSINTPLDSVKKELAVFFNHSMKKGQNIYFKMLFERSFEFVLWRSWRSRPPGWKPVCFKLCVLFALELWVPLKCNKACVQDRLR